jgi:hypothetical protein
MSADLIDQYRKLHEDGYFAGGSLTKHLDQIGEICVKHKPRTILDYGCGKAWHYERGEIPWAAEIVRLYDPAVPEFSEKPVGLYDGVVCTDVAEHLPEEEIDGFVRTLCSHAGRFLFLTVCTREATKKLPDGRNAHLTVKPREWWAEKLMACMPQPKNFEFYVCFTA